MVSQQITSIIIQQVMDTVIDIHSESTHQLIAKDIAQHTKHDVYLHYFLTGVQLGLAHKLYDSCVQNHAHDLVKPHIKKPAEILATFRTKQAENYVYTPEESLINQRLDELFASLYHAECYTQILEEISNGHYKSDNSLHLRLTYQSSELTLTSNSLNIPINLDYIAQKLETLPFFNKETVALSVSDNYLIKPRGMIQCCPEGLECTVSLPTPHSEGCRPSFFNNTPHRQFTTKELTQELVNTLNTLSKTNNLRPRSPSSIAETDALEMNTADTCVDTPTTGLYFIIKKQINDILLQWQQYALSKAPVNAHS